jgi:DNA-binding NarL/FixJ family response regulator
MGVIKVLIADDMDLHRELLRRLLDRQTDIQVVGEAGTPEEAVQLTKTLEPDVVLMDLRMPRHNPQGGIEATRQIVTHCPGVKVLALTESDDEGDVREATLAGAAGYILKSVKADRIAEAIRNAYRGRGWLDPAVTHHVLTDYRRTSEEAGVRSILTPTELEILKLVAEGLTAREIGEQLFIAEKTVKNHLTNVYRKLNVRNSSHAVAEAYRRGLLR